MLSNDPWVSLIGMIVVMAVIIGLAYWFTRYVIGGNQKSFGLPRKNEKMLILAQTSIGKDQRLAVIQAGSRYFLLGITAQNISMLAELSQEEASLWMEKRDEKGCVQTPPFHQAFMDALQKRKKG